MYERIHQLLSVAKEIKHLLFGAPYAKFAVILVTMGIALVAPSLREKILIWIISVISKKKPEFIGEQQTIYSILCGSFLIISGVIIYCYFYSREHPPPKSPDYPDKFRFSIPDNWSFSATAEAIAKIENALVDFKGFNEAELNAKLEEYELEYQTPLDALSDLGKLSHDCNIRDYDVIYKGNTFYFLRKENKGDNNA